MEKPVVVIKIGSSILANASGNLADEKVAKVAAEVAQLSSTFRVVLVSSGAVSSGKSALPFYKGKMAERKAAAAIGNPILIAAYSRSFEKYNIKVAQALLERYHFSDRRKFLQLKETITELWRNNILAIVNENDFVSDHELKFSDNDELATLIAVAFNAQTLILCTTSGGFLDSEGKVIPSINKVDESLLSLLRNETSKHGTGGMASKLTFTKLATRLGITVIMCGLQAEDVFSKAMRGEEGTTFSARRSALKDRQKWLASGSITSGAVQLDDGACKALADRKSLLAIGIVTVLRSFSEGEIVELVNPGGETIGVAQMRLSSSAIESGKHNGMAAHADNIVIF
ncbi:MAG TPA: glutamate 5-kinase [Flavisolibacter sp.]|jgi:glutamate 5-kinase|nr:glutamate 5-kinase [Flavisolibacter sp.]